MRVQTTVMVRIFTSQPPYNGAGILTSQPPYSGAGVLTSQSPYNDASISTSRSPFLSSAVSDRLSVCRTDSVRTRTPIPFPREQPSAPSDLGSHHVSDTLSRMPAATASTDHVYTHTLSRRPVTAVSASLHAFSRSMEPACTQSHQFYAPSVVAADPVLQQYQSDTHPRLHMQSRLLPESACTQSTMTSTLPCQPVYMPTRPPPSEEVLTSALPRPLTLVGPPYREHVVTSALPHPPTAPADFAYDTMQRDYVDDRNVYTNSIEQLWLTELSPPPHVNTQSEKPHAFSRVDVHHSRPAVADSTVQCDVCTLLPSATADHVRPTVTAHTAPLQSPSVHWRNGFHMTISSQIQG